MHPQKTQRVPRNLEQHRRTALPGKQPRHPKPLDAGRQVEKNNHQTRPKQLTKGTRRRTQRNKGSATPEAHKKSPNQRQTPTSETLGNSEGGENGPQAQRGSGHGGPERNRPLSKPTRGGAQSNTPGKLRPQGSQPQPARKDREPVAPGRERDGGQTQET